MSHVRQTREKFEDLFIPEPNSGCWLWLGSVYKDKKGKETYGRYGKRCKLAHRISYQKYYNVELNSSQLICHTCDNTLCINPEHLYVGNNQSNMDDMVKRGRSARGRGNAKITEEQARRIKYGNEPVKLLVRELKISKSSIWYIRAGINWSY